MKKQIDEMAKELQELANIVVQTDFDYWGLCWQKGFGKCPYEDTMNCQACTTAKNILDAGYQKVDEGKVVLTREEYQKDFSSQFNKGYKHGSKETAKEIWKRFDIFFRPFDKKDAICIDLLLFFLESVVEKYGVEVEQ